MTLEELKRNLHSYHMHSGEYPQSHREGLKAMLIEAMSKHSLTRVGIDGGVTVTVSGDSLTFS